MSSHKALWQKAWVETRSRFWIGAVILCCTAMMIVFAWPRASSLVASAAKIDLQGSLGREIRESLQLSSEYRGYAWDQWFAKNLTNMGTLFAVLREPSAAVRSSETVVLRHPIMPVGDGFRGGVVGVDGGQL